MRIFGISALGRLAWGWKLAVAVSALAVGAVTVGVALQPPSDASLRKLLTEKKPVFDELLQMLAQDRGIIRLSQRFIIWDDGEASGDVAGYTKYRDFDKRRWDHYRELLAAIGSGDGIVVKKNEGIIVFVESVRGALLIGTGKGIAYQFKPSLASWVTIVKSLDSGAVPRGEGEYVCPIEGKWYIYYDCSD
jgi:hypothetical protein